MIRSEQGPLGKREWYERVPGPWCVLSTVWIDSPRMIHRLQRVSDVIRTEP